MKDDVAALRDYQEQFTADNLVIEEYLNSYYLTVTNNSGQTDDQDVVLKIPTEERNHRSCRNEKVYFPKLLKETLLIMVLPIKCIIWC
jgi:hypothetical protein